MNLNNSHNHVNKWNIFSRLVFHQHTDEDISGITETQNMPIIKNVQNKIITVSFKGV